MGTQITVTGNLGVDPGLKFTPRIKPANTSWAQQTQPNTNDVPPF